MAVMDPNGVIVKEYELEGPKRNICVCVCVKMCAWGEGLLQPTRSWIQQLNILCTTELNNNNTK